LSRKKKRGNVKHKNREILSIEGNKEARSQAAGKTEKHGRTHQRVEKRKKRPRPIKWKGKASDEIRCSGPMQRGYTDERKRAPERQEVEKEKSHGLDEVGKVLEISERKREERTEVKKLEAMTM